MISGIQTIRGSLPVALVALTFSLPALAKCPVSEGTTVVVRAAVGDLFVDTSSREQAVDVQVENNAVQVQETCGKDVVQFVGSAPGQMRSTIAWKIMTPKAVHLDIVTM